jgi:acetoin utilization deacetylase AcuC-like enzyme
MLIFADPRCEKHDPGRGHPEQPSRYKIVTSALKAAGLTDENGFQPPTAVDSADLRLVHTGPYLELAEREINAGYDHLSTGDTQVCKASWEAALTAAGCAIAATRAVVQNKSNTAFCVVRPPGHHARPSVGMGFCVLNNVAIAAAHARKHLGIGRILIVDWDVHHGNGTQDVFYEDPNVFFFSTHQHPWYPGTGHANETGRGKGAGTTLNCPFPAGSGRTEILGAFKTQLIPAMNTFRPELVLISAGFDSREGDPLGKFRLTDKDFADLTTLTREIAAHSANGRVVSVLEGGYSLEGLAKGVLAHVQALK